MYFMSVFSWASSTAGPTSTPGSRPFPTLSLRVRSTSIATNVSATFSSTTTRLVAVQRCPVEANAPNTDDRSEEHTSELQSLAYLVCRLLLEKKKIILVGTLNLLRPDRQLM